MRKPREEHGLSKHPLYKVWMDMRERCYNTKHRNYAWYGAIGITVCEEWKNSFIPFYEWALANNWKPGLDLDKDTLTKGSKTYSPTTCKFITHRENMLAVVSRSSGRLSSKLKISSNQAKEIIARKAAGEKSKLLAKEFSVDVCTINRIYRKGC